ncbi:nitronate monooxygenase [Ferrimonas balearica]|uniref:NAD(P)H-dependent flavin oxidoreductase n=1 Tax=Ferrimonas balearica TaxID=44012 RepID=UPI001C93AF53|nr:nitronate monooxygenase [Ferrimonas balearica]MBY6105722.1 nitronate monooxygenase [Ferrimonas balearica]
MTTHPTLLQRLALRHPIIQAPMAGVATAELAAAVSNAGGLGSLAIGASSLEQAERTIRAAQALTDASLNINLFCHRSARRDPQREANWLSYLAPLFAEQGSEPPARLQEIYPSFNDHQLELLLALRPAVVSFHFGLPSAEALSALHQRGIVTLASATTPDEAQRVADAGVDAVVAQGIEAGGHRGQFDPDAPDPGLTTAELVTLLSGAMDQPIIAAGGIMDGTDAAKMLALGATAVQLGTAFVACPESSASPAYRAALLGESAHHTRLTATLSGRAARGMVNRFMDYAERPEAPAIPDYPVAYDAAKQLHQLAAAQQVHDFAAHWAGTGAPRARALPAAELMAKLVAELAAARP